MHDANPYVKVGTDCSTFKKVLDYIIANDAKLDFISFHRYGATTTNETEANILTNSENKYIYDSSNIYGVETARDLYNRSKGIELPVIMSEGNMNSVYTGGTDDRTRQMLGAVYTALSIRTFVLKKLAGSIYWNFGRSGLDGIGMVNIDNNQPWYPYYAQKMIGNNLAVGDAIVQSNSTSEDVRTLTWIHNSTLNILLICKASEAIMVSLQGVNGQLNVMKIDNTIPWQTPAIQTDKISMPETVVFNGYTVALLQGKLGQL
jgi:hypothetical protein